MLKPIDYLLDRITMYRLTLYYLIFLVLAAIGLSAAGVLHYNPWAIALSASYLTLICWITNQIFASVFEAPANQESSYITALILALIITPFHNPHDILFLTAAAGLAVVSKYILTIKQKHIFNPAAVAVVLTAFGPQQSASWWVGSIQMLPFVLAGGLLLVRKIQRGQMVATFVVVALASQAAVLFLTHHAVGGGLQRMLLHSSLWFLALLMLTEPLTSPVTSGKQKIYAVIVGALLPPQVHILKLYSTPELSLLAGNVFAYIVNPKARLNLKLAAKEKLAEATMQFAFGLQKPLEFKPGQYMEFTLPHSSIDSRGNRRYFTIASSPTEPELHLGIKFYKNGSSYKEAMLHLETNSLFGAGNLGGDFTLPNDPSQKLAFVAGGIGVTPYRSMIKYMLDKNEQRDVALFYSERAPQGFAYTDIFLQANERLGAKVIYTITDPEKIPAKWPGQTGYISTDMISQALPDYKERLFYISGPQAFVRSTEHILHTLGVPHRQIKKDFFPGYA